MLDKHILPENFDFGMPSVEMIDCGKKGLDKQAMVKRASAFEDVISELQPKPNRTYLHVITTGAQEVYGSNRNGDDFPETYQHVVFPYPENEKKASYDTDGGLKKYHDKTYMNKAAVYQEHHTKDTGPSGEIIAAKYNDDMHRGELIIAVDTDKWHDRLEKKANGQDIFLSMGCTVAHDTCFPKGTLIHTAFGYKPIETIIVGDEVYADDGELHSVVATMDRLTTEHTRLSIAGIPLDIECTPNHPILCAPLEIIRGCHGSVKHKSGKKQRRHTFDLTGRCITCNKHIDISHVWRRADELRDDDYVVAKIEPCAEKNTVGVDFAYICGQYVGNGSLVTQRTGHNSDGIYFAAGISIAASGAEIDRSIIDKIKSSVLAETGKTVCIGKYPDKNAYNVGIYDSTLATKVNTLCHAGSRTKIIGSDIHKWSIEEKLAFIGGYFDADGTINKEHGDIRISTVNRGLALEVQQLCWSVGIRASVHVGNTERSLEKNAFGCNGPCYTVYMAYAADKLVHYSAKLQSRLTGDFNSKSHFKSNIILTGGYAYLPIYAVRTFIGSEIRVYNLEVEQQHTYNAEGIIVHNCRACGRMAKTASEHCDHFKKMRCQTLEDGTQCSVINDAPNFYDISGVDVPADRIAFVLRKVASGEQTKEASLEAVSVRMPRKPMLLTKSALLLDKLSRMEKQVEGLIEGDKDDDEASAAFRDDDDDQEDFTLRVKNFPADEVIDSSSRKGILLSPKMLFKLIGKEMGDDDEIGKALCECNDDSCGDCSAMMRELKDDDDLRDTELLDGSFDQHFAPDLNLESILDQFLPMFSMKNPAVNSRSVHIVIIGKSPKRQHKEASVVQSPAAQEVLRRTYARYFISFAAQNDDATCMNALRKIAGYGRKQ